MNNWFMMKLEFLFYTTVPMKKAYLLVSFVLVYIHFGVG
jgi:hypothetical protein